MTECDCCCGTGIICSVCGMQESECRLMQHPNYFGSHAFSPEDCDNCEGMGCTKPTTQPGGK